VRCRLTRPAAGPASWPRQPDHREEGLADAIRFLPGSAETLPLPDAAFGAIFSVTVLEECDADRAIAEMVRVAAPGGRIGIIVRSLDLPQWWNLDLPEPIRRKIAQPPRSVAEKGVADASLYRRMRRAGLGDLVSVARPCSRWIGRVGRFGGLARTTRYPC